MVTKVSEDNIASIFSVEGFYPEDGVDTFLRNVRNHLHDVTTPKTTIDIFTAVRTSSWMTSVAESTRHTVPENGLTEREIICF
jgi:intracellular sulfur oxidation DsrE/DsrF family protein